MKHGSLKTLLGKKDFWSMPIDELIEIVDSFFPNFKNPRLTTFNYTLGKFPYGWKFKVVNSWYNWSAKKYEHEFGCYSKPEHALAAFLDYINKNAIDPRKLLDK